MFNENLKQIRKNKGISQAQLAKLLFTERYVVSNWEQGRSEPNLEMTKKLCVIFGISADELLEIETDQERKKVVINNSFNNNSGKQNIKF